MGLIVGATSGGDFGDLNLSTGQFTEIAALSSGYVGSLTLGPGGSFFAGFPQGDLYSISPTGVATQFGSVSAPPGSSGNQEGFWGLANGGPGGIYAADPNSNPTTLDLITSDGNSLSAVGPLPVTSSLGTGMISFAPNGNLYMDVYNSSGLLQLYQINETTGAGTAIGSGLVTFDNDALTLVSTGGQLYGIDTVEATGSGPINIYTINTTTGVATATGTTVADLPSGYTLDTAASIAGDGIQIFSADNTVGGSVAGAGNVISGNAGEGVDISGGGRHGQRGRRQRDRHERRRDGGRVQLRRRRDRQRRQRKSHRQQRRRAGDTAERNIISGNLFAGVWMTGSGTDHNVVAGNYIGTDVTGTIALANASLPVFEGEGDVNSGVLIDDGASDNLIGTSGHSADDVGQRNVISGNGYDGVDIDGSGTDGNVVAGNYIGTNAAGAAGLANGGDGVVVTDGAASNWIGVNSVSGGPENADQGNLISGNGYAGIQLYYGSTASVVAGNLIGTDRTGSKAIPNTHGIAIDSSNNLVGTSGQDGADDAIE